MEQLMNLREEVAENIKREDRGDELQHELLDTVRHLDAELSEYALFNARSDWYQVPEVTEPADEVASIRQQIETLF